MPRKPSHQHGIKPGQIVDWPDNAPDPELVASMVRFTGSTIHKTYPSPAGLPALRADKAKCDQYRTEDWVRLQAALRQGIRDRCVGAFRGQFPTRVWVWINEILHEARLTNEMTGEYHGFPINDAQQYPTPLDRVKAAPRVQIPVA